MSNGAADVNAGDSGINWLGRNSLGEVVDVAGAGLAVVRGPYPFAFDTPNIQNTGAQLGPVLAVGDVVLDGWFEIGTAFNGTNVSLLIYGPGNLDAVSATGTAAANADNGTDLSSNSADLTQHFAGPPSDASRPRPIPASVKTAGQCFVIVFGDTPSTDGAASLYLVIATPAATT